MRAIGSYLFVIMALAGAISNSYAEIIEIKSDSTTKDACTQAVMIADTRAAKMRNWSTGDYVSYRKVSDCKCSSRENIDYCTTSFEFTPVKAEGNSDPATKNK